MRSLWFWCCCRAMSDAYTSRGLTRKAALSAVLTVLLISAASASCDPGEETAPSPAGKTAREVLAYTLEHQPAHEALMQIRRLLSLAGTVEVQPGGNTLVIRDRRTVLARIAPVLEAFDHPPQDLRFQVPFKC